jgi:transposase
LSDKRVASAYIFAAVRAATDEDFAPVVPHVSAAAMDVFLAQFTRTLPDDLHPVMALDGAGWHDKRALYVPTNPTLVPLPPYALELNPVERIWLYLRGRYLSHRLLADEEAAVEACCRAWNALTAETRHIRSLCTYPYITWCASQAQRYEIKFLPERESLSAPECTHSSI